MTIISLLALASIAFGVYFMARLRPRLRAYIARRLGVAIRDGYAGAWDAQPPATWTTRLLVVVLDAGILIAALLGPITIGGMVAFCLLDGS